VPQKTTLLQNYPNPFNPETWIPYQLANNSTVVIKIYNFSGQLIRTLELGNNRAGYYTTPSQAVYWDGKNESGEFVSSGVYFYTIQGDNFAATRKMVLLK
jgi:flagellar hook assembly protein FlgD